MNTSNNERFVLVLAAVLAAPVCSTSPEISSEGTGGGGGAAGHVAGDGGTADTTVAGTGGGSAIGTGGDAVVGTGGAGVGGAVVGTGGGAGGAVAGTGGGAGGAVVGAGGATGIGGSTAVATIPPVCYPSGWCWENPIPTGASPTSVRGSSANDVWIGCSDGLALHLARSATTWATSPTGMDYASQVFAPAPDTAWISGLQGALASWDGVRWSPVASGTTSTIAALWGPATDDLWAVGEAATALHFDGARWSPTATPVPAADSIFAVHGADADDVWAAGVGTLIHWTGGGWTAVRPTDGATNVELRALWMASATDGWAGGFNDSSGEVVFYRWNGAAWNRVSVPLTGAVGGIWGLAANDVWAVGENGVAAHFDGSAWTTTATGAEHYLSSVWGARTDDVWAVGPHGLVVHWDGRSWTALHHQPLTEGDLYGGSFDSPSDGWVFGSPGILHWDGTGWTVSHTQTVYAVWANTPDDAWASGAFGAAWHWDGHVWTPTPPAGSARLVAISGFAGGNIWAVGDSQDPADPDTFHWAGGAWQPVASPAGSHTLFDVLALDETTALAVGDEGFVLQWTGGEWQQLASGTTAPLYAIWRAAPGVNDVWIGGANGTLLRWDGRTFTSMTAPTTMNVNSIWGSGPSDVWVASQGDNQVFHYDGASWSHSEIGRTEYVFGVAGSGADVWAVGAFGTILHHRR
jgi:hypothetical protein